MPAVGSFLKGFLIQRSVSTYFKSADEGGYGVTGTSSQWLRGQVITRMSWRPLRYVRVVCEKVRGNDWNETRILWNFAAISPVDAPPTANHSSQVDHEMLNWSTNKSGRQSNVSGWLGLLVLIVGVLKSRISQYFCVRAEGVLLMISRFELTALNLKKACNDIFV